MATVHTLRLRFSNAYLVRGERPILVDTGAVGEADRVLAAVRAKGVEPHTLALILLTHGHLPVTGCAGEIRRRTGAPIAIHTADAEMLRMGHNAPLRPTGFVARLAAPVVQSGRGEPTQPDLVLDGPRSLADFGIDGRVLETPGHTPGSVSLLLREGDALVGDLIMGGYLGGLLRRTVPNVAYFQDDDRETVRSLRRLLAAGARRFYVGHGGPLAAERVALRFQLGRHVD
ncbi:MAG TPA: MBL fold metallo-hydrolase [Gemmatimonadaceae bacterium]|nr:MBL fold metallo-hydrolase [Gemmatimonadaceae bacterium]